MRNIARYGWQPDLPDTRDLFFTDHFELIPKDKLPPIVNMRGSCPPVYDQGQLGSCTANAAAGDVEFLLMKEKKPIFTPSRLFIYYNERVIEGTTSYDAGGQLRDVVKSCVTNGAPPETDWPYDIAQFATKPPAQAYTDAKKDLVTKYFSIPQNRQPLMTCLAQGYPFIFGFTVYNYFESTEMATGGILHMPVNANEGVVGGHAVMCVGYTDNGYYIVRNSWGAAWGLGGYFLMPYRYMEDPNLCSDFWTLRLVTG